MLQEGQACGCTIVKSFCTQCGSQLGKGQVCACAVAAPSETVTPIKPITPVSLEQQPVSQEQSANNASNPASHINEQHPHIAPPQTQEQSPIAAPTQIQEQFPPTSALSHAQEQHTPTLTTAPHETASLKPPRATKTRTRNTYVESPTIISKAKSLGKSSLLPLGPYKASTPMVSEQVSPLPGETPIKQYHMANLRNLLRIHRAAGHLEITNKRVIYRIESPTKRRKSTDHKSVIHSEYSIENIAGLEAANSYRFSICRCIIGLFAIVGNMAVMAWIVLSLTHGFSLSASAGNVYFMARPPLRLVLPWAAQGLSNGWAADVGYSSIGAGLTAGFGGIVMFFLLRGKYLAKLFMAGSSFGGFAIVALSYNAYAFVLLVLGLLFAIFGLALFSWIPDLTVSLLSNEGVRICVVRGRRFTDALHGFFGIGYAEAAPAMETEAAIRELGAMIASDFDTFDKPF